MNAQKELLNALPSVFWTAVCLGPLYLFCARHVSLVCLLIFSVAGVLAMALPKSVLQRLALSSNLAIYHRLRVPILIRLTQDAGWLRRISRSSEPRVRRDRKANARIVSDTWMRERFHVGLFVFTALCSFMALVQARSLWFLALTLINALYNLYPIWLQQFLRLRVTRLSTTQTPRPG